MTESTQLQNHAYCQALVPSPVVLDPIQNQSKIQVQLGLGVTLKSHGPFVNLMHPSPVLLDPKPNQNQSKIKSKSNWDWGDNKIPEATNPPPHHHPTNNF